VYQKAHKSNVTTDKHWYPDWIKTIVVDTINIVYAPITVVLAALWTYLMEMYHAHIKEEQQEWNSYGHETISTKRVKNVHIKSVSQQHIYYRWKL